MRRRRTNVALAVCLLWLPLPAATAQTAFQICLVPALGDEAVVVQQVPPILGTADDAPMVPTLAYPSGAHVNPFTAPALQRNMACPSPVPATTLAQSVVAWLPASDGAGALQARDLLLLRLARPLTPAERLAAWRLETIDGTVYGAVLATSGDLALVTQRGLQQVKLARASQDALTLPEPTEGLVTAGEFTDGNGYLLLANPDAPPAPEAAWTAAPGGSPVTVRRLAEPLVLVGAYRRAVEP